MSNVIKADSDSVIDLGVLFSTLWRGKWVIAICSFLTVFLGGYYAYVVAVPQYTSEAVVILETQQNNFLNLESVVGGLSGNSEEVNSEVEVLRSRSLMGKVVDNLDLVRDPEFVGLGDSAEPSVVARSIDRAKLAVKQVLNVGTTPVERTPEEETRRKRDRAINELLSKINISNIPRSFVFQIKVTTEDAEKSARIADTIARLYILEQLEVKFEATEQATQWLSGRVSELQVQLEAAEAEVADFSASIDLVSVEALQLREVQLKDIRDNVADAEEAALNAADRLEALRAADDFRSKAAAADDIQLTRLLPRVETDTQVADAFNLRYEQIIARAELDVTRAGQQVEALINARADLEQLIDRQGADLITLQQLTREAEAVGLLYETFLRRLQEMSAQQGVQQADSRVLSSAVIPLVPSAPRKALIVAVSLLLGLGLGAGLVLLREARQNGFRTAQDLESHAGYTVLGQIPSIPARNRKRTLHYLLEKPASNAAEAYRNLRTSLMLSNVDNPPQVIISTSCIPGEGKTTNSLALAQNLTGLGKKVLLIEGDIRRRTFTQYFPNIPEKGLVSVLSGDVSLEDALVQDDALQASVLAGEKTSVNAADLFASAAFKTLISEMRDRFDAIIIDAPPVLVVPDARIIAETADAILFTVKWDSTSRIQIDEAMRMFHSAGQRITGFVLSQINARRMKAYGYGGRYGAYSGYGASYYKN